MRIRVQTRSREKGIEKTGPGEFKVKVKAPPVKGKANKELTEAIASHWGVPPSHVRIQKGFKSKNKLVWVDVPPQK
ncbi:DUF167 domain-containing protein [bacterium]|nr:DUF167 domain-containing protein [bacterium]